MHIQEHDQTGIQSPHDIISPGGVTLRAILIALGLIALLTPIVFAAEFRWNQADLFVGVPAQMPVIALFLVTGLMALPLLRRLKLQRSELLVVYIILLVAGPLIGRTTTAWLLVTPMSYYYDAPLQPDWQTVFLKFIPSWFAPNDRFIVDAFFMGQAQVPWLAWAFPLCVWGGFMLALFLCAFCMHAIFQHQWITNERLTFPLTQVPLGLVSESPRGARLPKEKLFWIGLLGSFGLACVNELGTRFPSIPTIPLGPLPLMPALWQVPLAGMGEITLTLLPWMIALAYLLPKDLSFSAWFFWWFLVAVNIVGISLGTEVTDVTWHWGSSFPAPRFQGIGALICFSVYSLWIGRHYLRQVFQAALSPTRASDPRREPLPYRLLLGGFFLTFFAMVLFLWAAGARFPFAVILVVGVLGYYIVWARLRAETGLGFFPFPINLDYLLITSMGSAVFTVQEKLVMNAVRWTYGQGLGAMYEVVSSNTLESFKIADAAAINKRRLSLGVIGAFVVVLAIALVFILSNIYTYGWSNLEGLRSGWFGQQFSLRGGDAIVSHHINMPPKPDINVIVATSIGAAFAAFLSFMRLRFWWWPFHPIGYMVGMCWGIHWYWMPFFIGWLCKFFVTRYGGLWLYKKTIPLAVGMIVGDILNKGIWSLIAVAAQGKF